jgi:integrase
VAGQFKESLKAANLPEHHTPYSLRHTFAKLHLEAGTSPVYVQRQLGHANISITVDRYGKEARPSDLAAADRLD